MEKKSVAEILRGAEDALLTAEAAAGELQNGPADRRLPSIRNVVVFGRAFVQILRQLRPRDVLFREWFDQHVGSMEKDPSIARFGELGDMTLRDEKEAINVTHLEISSAGAQYGPKPRNARAFFTGDRLNGTGWEVTLGDGRAAKYYVRLPEAVLPGGFEAAEVALLAKKYVGQLREMLRYAKACVR